jgi:uncharacterized protein YbjQ (UPF0145 family)
MMLLTADVLPENSKVLDLYGIVQVYGSIQISDKGIIAKLFGEQKNEWQEILDLFENIAPKGANVIYGIRVSTSTATYERPSPMTLMHVLYIGTAARVDFSASE